jgi:hypothetical protein
LFYKAFVSSGGAIYAPPSGIPPQDIRPTLERVLWEHNTWSYMLDLIRSTWMLLKPKKLHSNLLKEESYLHSLLAYVVNHSVNSYGEPSTIEEYVVWCKEFANECRERFVDSHHVPIPRKHQILDNAPKAVLAQLSTWMKALPAPYSPELDFQKWKDTFAPGPEALQVALHTMPAGLSAIDGMFRFSSHIAKPVNKAWVKQHGCLELDSKQGGTLAMLKARIPSDVLAFLNYASPSDRLEMLQRVWSQLWNACLQDIEEYDHSCSPNCSRSHHMPILHMLVSSLGYKNRHLSMNYSALQYLASILQKPFTDWLRNLPGTAEGLVGKSRLIEALNSAYKQIAGWKLYYGLYILSGDLSGCTNHFIPAVSQAAAYKAVAHVNGSISKAEDMIIRSSLGRYDIFLESPITASMRKSSPLSAAYALLDLEGSDHPRIAQTIGQHMSSSMSYPVMGTMHQSVFDYVLPRTTKRWNDPLKRQLFRRIAQGAGHAVYYFGVLNSGAYWRLSKGATKHLSLSRGQQAMYECNTLASLLHDFMERFDKAFLDCKLQPKYTFSVVRDNLPVESELGGVEYKAPGFRSELPGKIPARRYHGVHFPGSTELQKFVDPQKGGFGIKVTITVPEDKSDDPIIFVADSELRQKRLPSLSYPDGEYLVESMCYKTRVTITAGSYSWSNTVEPTLRLLYMWSIGDDHVLLSQSREHVDFYQKLVVESYNQEYNRKANYLSARGLVIAERLGLVDRRNHSIVSCPYIKVKQLVVPRAFGAGSSWMERSTSVRTQMLNEYLHAPGVQSQFLYLMIKNAERVLYWNNKKEIDYCISNSIDPRFPREIGGQEVINESRQDFSLVSWRHLVNLTYLRRHIAEYFPRYVKHIRGASNRFPPTESETRLPKLYTVGRFLVPRKKFKDFLYSRFGFVSMLSQDTHVKELSSREVCDKVKGEVNMVYSQLFPAVYALQTALEKKNGEIPTVQECHELHILGPQVPNSPSDILTYIDFDNRKLGISYKDLEFYAAATSLKEQLDLNQTESRVGKYGGNFAISKAELSSEFKSNILNRHLDEMEVVAALNMTDQEKLKAPESESVQFQISPQTHNYISARKPYDLSEVGVCYSPAMALVLQERLIYQSIKELGTDSVFFPKQKDYRVEQ